MSIRVERYTAAWEPAVRAFNTRLAAGNVPPEFLFAERANPIRPEQAASAPRITEAFIAVDGDNVHGAYLIQWQDFLVCGERRRLGGYQLPLSEGIVDKRYTHVGALILKAALQHHALLFSTGMGGIDMPLPRMLKGLGWYLTLVPFLFRVLRPSRFLQHIQPLRKHPARRLALDLAAFTGVGWLALNAWQRRHTDARPSGLRWEVVPRFGDWVDAIWERSRRDYSLCAVRDREALAALYPEEDPRYLRLKVMRGGEVVAWAVLLDIQMRGHKYFGDLRVGAVLDGMTDAGAVTSAAMAATEALADRGADLVVTNQLHADWVAGVQHAGFLRGPSNYGFAMSKQLARLLDPIETHAPRMHVTRGDGDGRVNLITGP